MLPKHESASDETCESASRSESLQKFKYRKANSALNAWQYATGTGEYAPTLLSAAKQPQSSGWTQGQTPLASLCEAMQACLGTLLSRVRLKQLNRS